MKELKHVFFDLDHTLWDFEKNAIEALDELYQFHQLGAKGVKSFEVFYQKYAQINNKMWELYRNGEIDKHSLRTRRFEDTFRELGVKEDEIPRDLWEHYLRITPEKTNLIPGARSLLDTLHNKGIKMHIITNGFAETQKRKLIASGLDMYFEHLFISEEIGFQKPMPQIFLKALEVSGALAENSIYIGDHPEADVQGGINAGLPVIFYNPGSYKHQFPVLADVQHLDEIELCIKSHFYFT